MATIQNIVLCGGGNAVHVMASDFPNRDGIQVRIYAPFRDETERLLTGISKADGITKVFRGVETKGKPSGVFKEPADVIPGADMVIIPLPSFAHRPTLEAIKPHLKDGTIIAAFPAQGAFELTARSVFGDDFSKYVYVGFNQLPYQCRINAYGESVELIGHKRLVRVGSIPQERSVEMAQLFSKLLGYVEVKEIGHFMNVTLHPANQVIHPCIMYGLFKGREGPQDSVPLFYQNMSDFSAQTLERVSDEVLSIAKAIRTRCGVDLSMTPSLANMMIEMYADELEDSSCVKSIFSTNKGYAGLKSPMVQQDDGKFVPDFGYRYLTDDIPLGLCVLRGLAELVDLETPTIVEVIEWAQKYMGKEYIKDGKLCGKNVSETTAPQRFGYSIESCI